MAPGQPHIPDLYNFLEFMLDRMHVPPEIIEYLMEQASGYVIQNIQSEVAFDLTYAQYVELLQEGRYRVEALREEAERRYKAALERQARTPKKRIKLLAEQVYQVLKLPRHIADSAMSTANRLYSTHQNMGTGDDITQEEYDEILQWAIAEQERDLRAQQEAAERDPSAMEILLRRAAEQFKISQKWLDKYFGDTPPREGQDIQIAWEELRDMAAEEGGFSEIEFHEDDIYDDRDLDDFVEDP